MNKFYSIMLIAMIFMVSCSKEEEVSPSDQKPDVEVYMSATTNGKEWTAETVTSSKSGEGDEYSIAILGQDADGNKISISFHQGINKPGTYQYAFATAQDDVPYSAFMDAGSNTIYGSYSGTLEILEYDLEQGIVKGTFEFTGMSAGGKTVPIIEGSFQIVY